MALQKLESVAVIPDGNRRFAKRQNLPLETAYVQGFKKAGEFSKWAFEAEVKSVSLWALSLENFKKRSQDELTLLFKLMTNHIADALKHPRFKEGNCKVKFFGRLGLLPESVQGEIKKLEEKTRDNVNRQLNIAIAYSGRDELLTASRKLAGDIASGKVKESNVTEDKFNDYLYFGQSPQLIIRTGNVQRLSGFLPWQTGYSELYFSPKLWPDFNEQDFLAAKEFYETTEQRFGK